MVFLAGLLLLGATGISDDGIKISPDVMDITKKYADGFGPQAEAELRTLSRLGDSSASALLGELLMMRDRIGGPDFAGSCDYSEKAGQFSSALHNLATCYFLGNGRPKDLTKSRDLYRQAAELGFPKAKCAYGNMLVRGDGGPAEAARGVDLCRQAADTGLPDAQTDYAGYLLTGKHVPKDAVRARTYLQPAAEKGHANAAFLLAQIYWYGDGIEKNVPQAAIWWLTAYEKGRKDAAFWVGAAGFNQVLEGAKNKEPVASVFIDQARKWLAIASREDPDPKKA
ncbi:MAG: sel1 repeat family protein [Pseudomonadota bacterium]|nr:sel1 repeat family protein [Pseudomonadota bacterium]